ncbi:XrtB/PEP-CTERM-associated transcriptional regulator EpsA [Xylophilus sp. GOD-11R]|uniref:XrtB/PEP-CTERM-associated transcriptional regulator EpsA n=1 Tax=Xylophilus sp. GOD-11R TaxID=3089814 RepID=UPI00298C4CC8|nr:XrtB/PEP-CTERM-associated transcriptional regulator EpsA [Xylophilus sp. GOD-11R]WPB57922.1 transcriptional regulator EpsA [Xylophilus sp. GOD-11R]
MTFFSSLSSDDISRYFRIITQAVSVKRHFDLLVWLQGDVQAHIPHDILVAGWGNFERGTLYHDVVSDLHGVRSENIDSKALTPFLKSLFQHWLKYQKRPFVITANEAGWFTDDVDLQRELGDGLQRARSMLVHGISDERGQHDCIYIILSTKTIYGDAVCSAMEVLLPYIDTALRQVAHLPHQQNNGDVEKPVVTSTEASPADLWNLSPREVEIMHWVEMGKTNFEIGSILNISSFTVKNHMQRIFKKLDVSNRMQAVSAFKAARANE